MPLKIGYYVKYADPKDGVVRGGLVISFDKDIVIIWKSETKTPYPIPRMNVKESELEFEFDIKEE